MPPLKKRTGQSVNGRRAGFPPTLPVQAQQAAYRWHLRCTQGSIPLRQLLEAVWLAAYMAGWAAHKRSAAKRASRLASQRPVMPSPLAGARGGRAY